MGLVVELFKRYWILLVIGAIVLGFVVFREHLSGSATDVRVGDCIELPTGQEEFSEVQHRPCGDPHDAEVYLVMDYPAEPSPGGGRPLFPSTSEMDTFLDQECTPAFETYTGLSYQSAEEFDFGAFVPTRSGWDDGDHEVTCYIYRVDGAKITGSMRAAAQ